MKTITARKSLSVILFTSFVLVTFFGFTTVAAAADIPRIKISIDGSGVTAHPAKNGKLETRQSGERQITRLKITPVETEDGRIRVIVPISDLSTGFNVISVPARLLDARDGETGGKLQTR